MKSFKKYILEYRKKLADGTDKPSVQAHNGKNPNRLDKKNIHTVGEYKPASDDAHNIGKILNPAELQKMLDIYGFDFVDGGTHAINNSGKSVYMYTQNGRGYGKIIESE